MPFNREYRKPNGEPAGYYVNRDRTGPPVPPQPGVVQTNTGIVVGSDTSQAGPTNVVLQPDKEIPVTIPGPREKVIDAQGNMSPRWRRFFEELYRRTGFVDDNVNAAEFTFSGSSTAGAIGLTGYAPSIDIQELSSVFVGSASFTGYAPTVTVA